MRLHRPKKLRGPVRARLGERRRTLWRATLAAYPLIDFLFPDSCLFCGAGLARGRAHLCARCWRRVSPGLRPVALPDVEGGGDPRAAGTPAFYLLPFEGPTRALIHALKFGRRTSVARALVEMTGPLIASLKPAEPAVVAAVPLHTTRLRERGFNQAALLAEGFARSLEIPMSTGLRRRRATANQTGLSRERRIENVVGAFRAEPTTFDGAGVLLVDDVVTTGATLAEAAAALRLAGARSVTCLAAAGRP